MTLRPDPNSPEPSDPGYVMDGDYAWIRVKGFDVCIVKTDEGVVVDIWEGPDVDQPEVITSAYAFDGERA